MNRHERLMDGALAEARAGLAQGEQPFGAVIAGADGEILARARSLKVSTGDPTAHSELLAIRAATGSLGRRTLEDCTFYGTCEPCPMCLGAMFNAGLPRLVLGARLRDLGDIAFAFGEYSVESFAAMVGWPVELIQGVRQAESNALYATPDVTFSR